MVEWVAKTTNKMYYWFTERRIGYIGSVASAVPHIFAIKRHAIAICSTIWFHPCPPKISHNVSSGCPPHAFFFSIGAIHPRDIRWSESFWFNVGLDGSQFLVRWYQSQSTAIYDAVCLSSGMRHWTTEETIARVVDPAPAIQACLLQTN